jgi:hypothetical protein
MFENAKPIHTYIRADTLWHGFLIDVSANAWEAGIRWPPEPLAVAEKLGAGC